MVIPAGKKWILWVLTDRIVDPGGEGACKEFPSFTIIIGSVSFWGGIRFFRKEKDCSIMGDAGCANYAIGRKVNPADISER